MSASIANYIISIIIVFVILFAYCHIAKLKTLNNELKILQVYNPEPEIIYELLGHSQAIVFQKELTLWKEFNKLLGKSLTNIKTIIASNTEINYTEYIKNNINIYNLPLSYDWNIDMRNIVLDNKSPIFFIKQNNYMQLFGCVSGEMRFIVVSPDQNAMLEPFINMVSTIDATLILDKDPIVLNFIEIIIREGNMIYIPWGWYYFIYKNILLQPGINNSECVIVDCINQSALNVI